jgi:hypothetical protein
LGGACCVVCTVRGGKREHPVLIRGVAAVLTQGCWPIAQRARRCAPPHTPRAGVACCAVSRGTAARQLHMCPQLRVLRSHAVCRGSRRPQTIGQAAPRAPRPGAAAGGRGRGAASGTRNRPPFRGLPSSHPHPHHEPHEAPWLTSCAITQHTGQKRRYWLVLKEIIRAAPCFFLHVLAWY